MYDGVDDVVYVDYDIEWNESTKLVTQRFPRIAVDPSAAAALLRGADLMAVGVLATDAHNADNCEISMDDSIGSDQEGEEEHGWGVRKGQWVSIVADVERKVTIGERLSAAGSHLPANAPFIGNGVCLMGRGEMRKAKAGVAVEMRETAYPAPPLNEAMSASSSCFLMNLPSALVAHVLSPLPGDRVFDMCAAPGGKSSHLAQVMGNDGEVLAGERAKSKVKGMSALMDRLNASCVTPIFIDSTKAVRADDTGKKGRHKGFEPASFDKILLDPPCSGLGLRPCLRYDYKGEELRQHAQYQRKLIAVAVQLLKPGGSMVYSTCTLHPLENEGNIAWALQEFSGLTLERIQPSLRLGSQGLPNCGLDDVQRAMVMRFDPLQDTDTNAFFLAKLSKRK